MKKLVFCKVIFALTVVLSLALGVSSQNFTRKLEYTEGTFYDVPADAWYASEVSSAYELGFMNGKSDTAFVPDGYVTVAEGITMASRVHAIYNGKTIAEKNGGNWYDMYVDYAEENGLIEDDSFSNLDRNIMRYEMAMLFADAMPASCFAAKNEVKVIPDVAKSEKYHDKLMMLYNAGIVMGSTEYGDFLATNSIKRSETAAIINRVALPENRLKKTLLEYGDRENAIFLIDNHSMTRTVRSRTMVASGWRYENTIDVSGDLEDKSSNSLVDMSSEGHVAIHRDVTTVERGIVELELVYVTSNPGYSIVLSDIDGRNMFTFMSKTDKSHSVIADFEQKTGYSYASGIMKMYFRFDLDSRKADVVLNGTEVGVFDMSKTATDISRLSFITDDEGFVTLSVSEVYMYAHYSVNDAFRMTPIGASPYGWKVDGKVTVQTQKSDLDTNSVRVENKTSSVKKFSPVSGKFVYETFVKIPDSQTLTLTLKSGDTAAVSVTGSKGKFVCADAFLRNFTSTIWQLVRIEGDTDSGTAVIKVNNKYCYTAPLNTAEIDCIEITSDGKSFAWYDDVEFYKVHDYADYCPVPVPVTDDEWYVGMSVCSLWREGTHYGWDCITPYDEATPVLGYYDEGLSEVADWEIKMLVEHGYDFQHFCWYVGSSSDGIKEPRLGDALHNGYMNARYSNMQDFMLMWENNSYSYTHPDDFKRLVWDYWCDWYFSDDRYFTIDNKPVLTIYQYQRFIEDMGGEENAIETIKFMREDIKKLGYDGMIILFCSNGASQSANMLMKRLGGDAFICYNFGENSYDADFQMACMNSAFKNGHISLMPSVSVGFNDIGWTETRTPNATPEVYKEVLEWCRDDYMTRLDEREEDDWKSRFVIGNTWNEYGEGHYIMPTNLNKFGYVDANRSVFSSAANSDDSAHFDVEPTDNQKARLCYLFPDRTQLIRRTYLLDDIADYEDELQVIKSWNFENKNDCMMWLPLSNTSSPVYSESENALVGVSHNNDPSITLIKSKDHYLDAETVKLLKIKIKYDAQMISSVALYFRTENDREYTAARGMSVTTGGKSGYADYYLDLSSNRYWTGTITDIRLDPSSIEGEYYIKSIEFLGKKDNDDQFRVEVDGNALSVGKSFVVKDGKDVYVAGNPSDGFYSIHNFYTEWNRHSGELMLKTGTGHMFNFTVGSNIVLVDGKETTISRAFEVIDGLPAIPLKFIYDNAGIKYTEKNNGFITEIRGDAFSNTVKSRIENEYEFNVDADLEGWLVSNATAIVSDGRFVMTSNQSSNGTYDPMMTNVSVALDASVYTGAEVRVKMNFDNPDSVNSPVTFYFATTEDTKLSESKSVKVAVNSVTPDKDGFYTFKFDLSSNEAWRGSVMTIRFDPTNSPGCYEIDYLRMIMDPDAEERIKQEKEYSAFREEKLGAADEGKPFYIENADAENIDLKPLSHNSYVALKIVEDDLRKGNHAFEYVPSGDKKNWAYTMIPTRFKPGVTYKVELDIRVTKDHTGAEIDKASLAWNLRYTDVVNNAYKSSVDHHSSLGTFGTKDGWKHVSFTHTISEDSIIRDNDYFAIFANPIELPDGSYRVVGYMLDNIEVSVVE